MALRPVLQRIRLGGSAAAKAADDVTSYLPRLINMRMYVETVLIPCGEGSELGRAGIHLLALADGEEL